MRQTCSSDESPIDLFFFLHLRCRCSSILVVIHWIRWAAFIARHFRLNCLFIGRLIWNEPKSKSCVEIKANGSHQLNGYFNGTKCANGFGEYLTGSSRHHSSFASLIRLASAMKIDFLNVQHAASRIYCNSLSAKRNLKRRKNQHADAGFLRAIQFSFEHIFFTGFLFWIFFFIKQVGFQTK